MNPNQIVKLRLQSLENRERWADLDIPRISELELLDRTAIQSLKDDEQTRLFVKFLSTATNFSSETFADKMNLAPMMVQNIQDLIVEMKKEIKDFKEIAIEFTELVHLFIRVVMNTKHNLNMILPDLRETVFFIGLALF